jgi:hypothetical protein
MRTRAFVAVFSIFALGATRRARYVGEVDGLAMRAYLMLMAIPIRAAEQRTNAAYPNASYYCSFSFLHYHRL